MWFCLLQRKKCGSPPGISTDFPVENHTLDKGMPVKRNFSQLTSEGSLHMGSKVAGVLPPPIPIRPKALCYKLPYLALFLGDAPSFTQALKHCQNLWMSMEPVRSRQSVTKAVLLHATMLQCQWMLSSLESVTKAIKLVVVKSLVSHTLSHIGEPEAWKSVWQRVPLQEE